jgi:hypothetical protein
MNASSDPALPIVDPPNLNDLPADFSGHVIDFFEESHRLLTAAALVGLILGFGEQRNLMPSSALCREFLGQRRGARRLESIRRVAAATVG